MVLFLLTVTAANAGESGGGSHPSASGQKDPTLDLAEEAGLQFDLGVDAYRRRDWNSALEHLLASNRLVPNRNVVYNIARAYEQLSRYDDAYRHYADYVEMETDAKKRGPAVEAIEHIRARVALVQVTSDPPGATIFVDRRDLGPRGSTPRTLALPPGPHVITLEKSGWLSAISDTTSLTVGQQINIGLQLDPVLGEVRVDGGPSGAEIRLDDEDGAPLGTLPGAFAAPPGKHLLIVSSPGYRAVRQTVDVEPSGTVRALAELPLVTGTLVVDAAERGALIAIDGQAAGFTPAVLPTVAAGKHRVQITLAGFRAWETDIVVQADGSTKIEAPLVPLTQVTAASRTTQSVEDAPASVTVIGADELRAFGDETVYGALSGARGVFPSNDRTYEYLGFRGFGRPGDYNNRVLLTMDGHALNDDQLGASYFGHDLLPDLLDVERIELVRGPGSALYGTNAFFGVINLVTRERDSARPTNVSLAADGERAGRIRVGTRGKFGNDAGFRASAGAVLAQGADFDFAEYEKSAGDGRSLDADGYASEGGTAKLWKGDFSVNAYANHRDKRIPTGAFETDLADERAHSDDLRAFAEVAWAHAFSARVHSSARAFVDRYDYAGDFSYGKDVVHDRWSGTWVGAELRTEGSPVSWFRLTGGGEVDAHVLASLTGTDDSGKYLDETPTYQVYSGYAVAEADAGTWLTASVGARADYFTTVGPAISPRFALIARPGADHTVKLLGGTAFRAPSPYELDYNDGGTTQIAAPSLTPERIASAEAEYTVRFGQVTTGTIAVFGNRIESLIDLAERSDAILQYQNTDDAVLTAGGELELRREWRGGWMGSIAQSFQRTRTGDLMNGAELTNSPAYTAALKLAAPILPGAVQGASRVRVESGRLTTTGDSTDPALIWDVMLTGLIPSLGVDWGLGVKNVLDWKYAYPGGEDLLLVTVPQPGRTAYAQLTASF